MSDGLFDTNILVDPLKGISQARAAIESYARRSIRIVTWMEVLVGADAANELRTRNLLNAFTVVPITSDIAERAVLLRRTMRIKLPDAVILATAQIVGCVLVTRNTKDFDPKLPDIRVPYQI